MTLFLLDLGFLFVQHHTAHWLLLILKLHVRGNVTISLINNEVRHAYIGYNFICHIERKDLS